MSDAQVLGNELREAREARDLTLEQVEKQTRIRARYIEALEQGNFTVFQTSVQASGFLRNYARFLGLDADELVERYNIIKSGRRRRREARPKPAPTLSEPTPARRTQSTPAVVSELPPPPAPPEVAYQRRRQRRNSLLIGTTLLGFALLVLGGIVFVGTQVLQTYLSRSNPDRSIFSTLASNETPLVIATNTPATLTSTPDRPTPLPVPNANSTATNSGTGPVALQLSIVERTWLRVTVDGQISYMGSVAPNTVLQYQGTSIQVRIENAAGVHAALNGKDLGIMGTRGQIVDQTFTANGAIPATPGPAPQGTASAFNSSAQTAGQTLITSPGATFSLTALPRGTLTPSVLPTITPSQTYTRTFTPSTTPTNTGTPTFTFTPSKTLTPSLTSTPSLTPTPSITYTPSLTLTATVTPFVLPHETSTPEGGEIRKQ